MNNKFTFSIISWVITALIVFIFMLPIYSQIGDAYPFYVENIAFIVLLVTFARFIFLTKFHWFSHYTPFKIVMIFLMIPVLMYVIDNLWDFQTFMDEKGISSIMQNISADAQRSLAKYIKAEMTFFWAGAFISSIALALRMMHSIFRLMHRGKV